MTLIKLPGLIDPHVHLRDPGQTGKEDFYTGTCAALAGGYTTVIDMPNNKTPITTLKRLHEKEKIAKEKIVCDVGFHFGSLGDNLEEFEKVKDKIIGLKLFLNQTTGNFLISKETIKTIFEAWPKEKVILLHAEEDAIEYCLKVSKQTGNRIHFCHISTESDLQQIMDAKNNSQAVTCGVTPHHLFLNHNDAQSLGAFGTMKPILGSKKDQEFLWKNIEYFDIVESDHAPHTVEEKEGKVSEVSKIAKENSMAEETNFQKSPEKFQISNFKFQIPYGVPGLETTLPLLLTAVSENRLTIDDVIQMCSTNPAKIFGIKQSETTYIEIALDSEYVIKNEHLFTKCKWSPFDGWKVKGKVVRVYIRGTKVFENGKILVKPGFGKIITPQ